MMKNPNEEKNNSYKMPADEPTTTTTPQEKPPTKPDGEDPWKDWQDTGGEG